jgi:alkylation response protein AidB-like acyl-CoA dehydrogenase
MSTRHPVAVAESFLAELRSRAAEIEAARDLPQDLARRMAQAGMFRLLVPERYGGDQVHPRDFFDALVTTARGDGAVGWCQMIGATTGLLAGSLPETWAQAIYGDHPDGITCGVTAPMGRAEPVEGGYRISGRWPFGSGCRVADWICGGCLVMEDGAPRPGAHGVPEAILVMFPAHEVTIHDTWHTSGLCGTGSHDIEVRDALVPEGRWTVLGKRATVDAALYRFPTLGLLALGVSAVALGIAEHAIEAFIELAGAKVPTGSRRTLAERAGTQKDLARARALVASARAYTHDAVDRAWRQAEQEGRLGHETKAELRLAATNNAWSAVEAVDLMYHLGGGTSIYRANDLQRCFRDVHVTTQHIMVAQPTYEVVGKVMLGIDPKTLL